MDLEAEGRHALLFDDDAMAAFVNSREALVPWSGDESLLIDRYDVRHLLDRIPARPPRRYHPGRIVEDSGTASVSELDLERYLDLPPPDDPHGGDLATEAATGGGSYQAVPFSYDNPNSSADPKYFSGSSDYGFHPPFAVPESLHCNLPPTEKLHQIIARTATFVSGHGGQSEIVLRVKQGDNPTFGFLMPDHDLHAYFRYLVDHPELLKADAISSTAQGENKSNDGENEMHTAGGGALSLLGSVYGSGEEDDFTLQPDSEAMKLTKLNAVGSAAISHRSEQGKSSIFTTAEEKEVIGHTVTPSVKEKISTSKWNHSMNVAPAKTVGSKKTQDGKASLHGAMDMPQTSQIAISDTRISIVEPPSSLKGTMDKIVEFILRNGKEFEAILIEQDKGTGRFPFLLPSNLYHSYYLKILNEARESKLQGKNQLDQKNDALSQDGSKKRKQKLASKELTSVSNLAEESVGWRLDLQKEKFRMIIGQKKDKNERAVLARRSGVTADEAAAIVMTATRGQSPATVARCTTPARQSGASVDEVAAIVQAATRGSSPAIDSQNMSVDELVMAHTRDSGRASSIGSFSSLVCHDSILKLPLKDKAGISLPVNSSVSSRRPEKDGCGTTSDVLVAKAIAKTVALAASNEADSSEACLTKEQKLKADRLKRAKMFAALIRSGSQGITEGMHSISVPNESLEASNAGSVRSGVGSDLRGKEREGSSVPIDAENSDKAESQEKDSMYDRNGEHRFKKKHLSRSRDRDELEEDHSQSSKRHRYEDSSYHSRRHQKHGKSHSSEVKESRHHHKRHSSPEEQRKHRKSYRSHHRHEDGSSEDDGGRRRDGHRRKHHSHSRRKQVSESEDEATFDHLEKKLSSSYSHHPEVGVPSVSDARPSDSTEVPSELRAKIRAMLLEIMQ